jgi:hypothetical protein
MEINSSTRIDVKVGKREVLTSGILHFESDQSITVNIDNLSFKFLFRSDGGPPKYEGTMVGNTLEFTLSNHSNSLGEGLLEPLEVARLDNRPLSFTYYVNTVNLEKGARRFEYAFYLGDAA